MTMTTITSQHRVEPEVLMAYLDGELSPDRAAETASHLEDCQECQALAADLGGVSQKLIEWQIEAPEAVITERVSEALDEREQGKQEGFHSRRRTQMSFLKHGLQWAGGLAAIFVIILAIATPNLMRSRKAAEESARVAQERQQVVANQSPGYDRYTPKSGSKRGLVEREQSGDETSAFATTSTYTTDGTLSNYDGLNKLGEVPTTTVSSATSGQGSIGKLQQDQVEGEEGKVPVVNGPMIIRTAELSLTTNKFDQVRTAVEEILKRHKGYVGELNVNTPTGSARSLAGALRVPAAQLDAALADLKGLGRVEKESQGGEEVTQKYVDLEARLANAKHTEQRLTEMLRDRTGKLSDVLAVEMQISRVRGEIEQMEAERKELKNQVDYATLNITVNEDYKAELKVVPPSTSTQIRNAAVEGYRNVTDGLLGVFLSLLSVLPALLVWCGLLFFPARFAWKKLRLRFAREDSSAA
jgi:hypothetical protein